jgi:exodeoxyribonuclease VII small subunit
MASEGPAPSPSFEEAFEALRRAVQELEAGPLPLDVAIARYEDGIRLAQVCNDILDKAELRISQVLRDSPGGSSAT